MIMTTWSICSTAADRRLGIHHLRLIMGTSMGCMHGFAWGEMYPDLRPGDHADGVPAGRDRRPEPHVAPGG
jgi:hypothetical protein